MDSSTDAGGWVGGGGGGGVRTFEPYFMTKWLALLPFTSGTFLAVWPKAFHLPPNRHKTTYQNDIFDRMKNGLCQCCTNVRTPFL